MGIINTPENPNVMICDNKKRCSTPFIVAVQGLSFKINENLYFDGVRNHKKKVRYSLSQNPGSDPARRFGGGEGGGGNGAQTCE